MKTRNRILSVTALVIFVCALAMTAAGCSGNSAVDSDRIALLEQDCADLRSQVNALTARLEALESTGLKSWNLTAQAWSSSNGATVTLTAEPSAYTAGQAAELVIRLNGQAVDSVPCVWDGSTYTASVDLNAADGYGYYCVLISPDGTREQIALNTPENPVDDTIVYMASSLSTYCNLYVMDWELSGGQLTVTSGYIQVQTPRLSASGETVSCSQAELVFQLNGQEIERQAITLPEGEGAGSYETILSGVSFSMPEMGDDYQLDLWLDVGLSDGSTIFCSGGSWYYYDGQLSLIVG